MLRAWLFGVLVLLSPVTAGAQVATELRFYLVPKIGTGEFSDPFRAKYLTRASVGQAPLVAAPFDAMDYGSESTFLVAADVTTAQHTTLSAQVDVLAVPSPIDDVISGAALSTVQDTLEAMNIPGQWVTTSHTYRDVLRVVGKMILIVQRYNGLFGNTHLFETGITLETQWNQLTAAQKQRLQAVANSFALDTTGIQSTMTLRTILRLIADQLPAFTLRATEF